MGIVNKQHVYFDVLSRTDKSLMLWSLADATVNAKNKHVNNIATRDDITYELVFSLDNIRTAANHSYGDTIGSGSYNGTEEQFRRQYTPGLEFGVWKSTKNNNFVLTTLAEELQKGNITNEEYISIVLFNYIQIIDGKIVSILKECVESAFTNPNYHLTVNDIYSNSVLVNPTYLATCDDKKKKNIKGGSCKLLFNILSETIYFTKISEDTIQYNGNVDDKVALLNAIETSILTASTPEELTEVLSDLNEQQFYAEYITRTPMQFTEYLSKHYSKIIQPNVVLKNDLPTPIIINKNVTLQEDLTKPNIPVKPYTYTGRTRKTDFIERNKRQAKMGKAAEQIVYMLEVERIRNIDPSLVDNVIWHSDIYGDGAGYDIKSIDIDSRGNVINKYIEVKATSCNKNTPIEVTKNEVECSKYYKNEYIVYRLYDFKPSDNVFKYYTLVGDLTNIENVSLIPTSYKMYF